MSNEVVQPEFELTSGLRDISKALRWYDDDKQTPSKQVLAPDGFAYHSKTRYQPMKKVCYNCFKSSKVCLFPIHPGRKDAACLRCNLKQLSCQSQHKHNVNTWPKFEDEFVAANSKTPSNAGPSKTRGGEFQKKSEVRSGEVVMTNGWSAAKTDKLIEVMTDMAKSSQEKTDELAKLTKSFSKVPELLERILDELKRMNHWEYETEGDDGNGGSGEGEDGNESDGFEGEVDEVEGRKIKEEGKGKGKPNSRSSKSGASTKSQSEVEGEQHEGETEDGEDVVMEGDEPARQSNRSKSG